VALKRICLDTSAYSHFKRGRTEVVDIVRRARVVGVPAVVLGELRAGFLLGDRPDENEAELQEFLQHPAVVVHQVDDESSVCYAKIVVALRRGGTPLPTNDIWVAALAVREGSTIVTYDEHFRRISGAAHHILQAAPA